MGKKTHYDRMSEAPVGHVEFATVYDWPKETGPFTVTRTEVLGRFDTRDEARDFMRAYRAPASERIQEPGA